MVYQNSGRKACDLNDQHEFSKNLLKKAYETYLRMGIFSTANILKDYPDSRNQKPPHIPSHYKSIKRKASAYCHTMLEERKLQNDIDINMYLCTINFHDHIFPHTACP